MDVECRHEGPDYHLLHDDHDGSEDGDRNEDTCGRPVGNFADEEDGGGLANDIGACLVALQGSTSHESATMAIFASRRTRTRQHVPPRML